MERGGWSGEKEGRRRREERGRREGSPGWGGCT